MLAVIFGALLLRRTWLSVHDLQLERTALLAVVGVLLHDVFDFALELQALAVAATVTTGMVLGAAPSSERRRVGQRGAFWAAVPVTLAVATLSFGMPAHHQAEQQVVQTIRDRRPLEQLRERALRAIDRHPADWVLYSAMSSEVATRGDGRDAIAWVNRLLFLRPHHATAHLAAAQALLRLGNPSQALGELKEAWMLGDTQSVDLGIAVALKQGQLDRLLIDRPGHLRLVWGRLRARSLDEQARRLLDSVEFSAMGDEVRAEAAVLLVQHESELGDAARALEAWERLPEATRGDLDQSLVRVTLLTRLHRDDEAIALLERLVARYPSELRVALLLADNLAARGRPAAAREVLERSRPFFSGPQQRASLFEREAA
ncbi:MAG TPA: tetratricopeptide repeat protein, partial [Archangium sp.]